MDRAAFFGGVAGRWDQMHPAEAHRAAMTGGLDRVEPLAGATVVEVGCATGTLAAWVLDRLGDGRYVGVDFAPAMVERAAARLPDPRASWRACDVLATGLAGASADVVLCYNTFPHFPDKAGAVAEMARWLRPGGRLLIWHGQGRDAIEGTHRRVGGAIGGDALPPAEDVAVWCRAAGLDVRVSMEATDAWMVLAVRREET
jgi:demethylmenaquinone methyltransferase/2-methoxy-6-polyprenyl-1,4-benzoquinol methylase